MLIYEFHDASYYFPSIVMIIFHFYLLDKKGHQLSFLLFCQVTGSLGPLLAEVDLDQVRPICPVLSQTLS